MLEDEFWTIVDRVKENSHNPDDRIAALRSELTELTDAELVSFQANFEYVLSRAYSWDLWSAASIAHGGCSDDGFEYFRRWLVSQGRRVFESAVADPETLTDVPTQEAGPDGMFEFEEYFYVAVEVFEQRTGRDVRDEGDRNREMQEFEREPSGTQFSEDQDAQALRYPRLWAKYGESPLG